MIRSKVDPVRGQIVLILRLVQQSQGSLHHVFGDTHANDLSRPQVGGRRGDDVSRQPDGALSRATPHGGRPAGANAPADLSLHRFAGVLALNLMDDRMSHIVAIERTKKPGAPEGSGQIPQVHTTQELDA